MSRFQYKLAQRPRLHAAMVGVAAALLCLAAFVAILAMDQLRRLEDTQHTLAYKVQGISNDTRNILRRLTQTHAGDCSEASLLQLRQEVFVSTYQVDIGVLDERQRLICTTVMGRLPYPVSLPAPDAIVKTLQGEEHYVNFEVPLIVADWRTVAMMVRMGRFNTVVNPYALEDMFGVDEGTLRIRVIDGSFQVAHADPTLSGERADRLGQGRWIDGDVHGYSWSEQAFVSSRLIAGTPYLSQFVVPLERFWEAYAWRLGFVLLLSLAAGGLVYGALSPALQRWGLLEHRIAGLIHEDNVLCMYQPIVDMRSGATVGCEVLMRLRDGSEVLAPDRVLPLVARAGLCWKLDQSVVRQAIRELCTHLPAGTALEVSFNFFPENIRYGPLRELIETALPEAPRPDLRFNLEVIEQGEQGGLLGEIASLKQSGYLVSIDDFGTGYSNLNSVKALAPDFIKIDKSFVFEMEDASVRSSLIPEIVSIARAVGAEVIAEGIENEPQRERLLSFGVDYGQGFLFARPMVIGDFVAYLRAAGAHGDTGRS